MLASCITAPRTVVSAITVLFPLLRIMHETAACAYKNLRQTRLSLGFMLYWAENDLSVRANQRSFVHAMSVCQNTASEFERCTANADESVSVTVLRHSDFDGHPCDMICSPSKTLLS